MRVRKLVQLRKASTIRVIRITETVNERAHQYLHGPVNIQRQKVRLHVLQKVGADQLTQLCLAVSWWTAPVRRPALNKYTTGSTTCCT
eukprot:590553-Pleurochrysis_carterae.AAC.1